MNTHGDAYDAFVGPTILPEEGRYYSTAVLLNQHYYNFTANS